MKELQKVFSYRGRQVRTIIVDGQPWWVAKDVCNILELNTSEAVRGRKDRNFKDGLEYDEYRDDIDIVDGIGRNQKGLAVNEPGLYNLIFKSRKPEAKDFKRWVTHEVIPSIRKHGAYLTPQKIEEVLLNPDTIIQLATQLKQEQEERRLLQEKVKADRPKVLFADSVQASHTSILIRELAKILKQNGIDTGQNRLFQWLRDNGYLIRRRGTDYNMPTQRAMEMGLFEIKETTITHSDGRISISKTAKVTGKGQLYFVNKLLTREEAI